MSCNCKNGVIKSKNGAVFVCRDCSKHAMLEELNDLLRKTKEKLKSVKIDNIEEIALNDRIKDLKSTIEQVKGTLHEY